VIFDGPEGGHLREHKKWIESDHRCGIKGVATGAGIYKIAVAIFSSWARRKAPQNMRLSESKNTDKANALMRVIGYDFIKLLLVLFFVFY